MSKIKIDLEVLEELWDGKIYPAEQCSPQNNVYKEMTHKLDKVHTQLIEVLEKDSVELKLFEYYENQMSSIMDMEHKEAFKKGFCLAVSIAAEILVEQVDKQ